MILKEDKMLKLALLISGNGTTAKKIFLACQKGELKGFINPAVVIASKDNIKGITRLKKAGFPNDRIFVCNRKQYNSQEEFGEAMLQIFRKHNIDLIGQYGWLPLTPENVIAEYPNKIINQHPGPLYPGHPDFGGKGMYGMRVHFARLCFARFSGLEKDQFTEATAHYVSPEYDKGCVIGKVKIPILSDDDVNSLSKRVRRIEQRLHIKVLKQFAQGTVTEQGRDSHLVHKGQFKLLEESKEMAEKLFPRG